MTVKQLDEGLCVLWGRQRQAEPSLGAQGWRRGQKARQGSLGPGQALMRKWHTSKRRGPSSKAATRSAWQALARLEGARRAAWKRQSREDPWKKSDEEGHSRQRTRGQMPTGRLVQIPSRILGSAWQEQKARVCSNEAGALTTSPRPAPNSPHCTPHRGKQGKIAAQCLW